MTRISIKLSCAALLIILLFQCRAAAAKTHAFRSLYTVIEIIDSAEAAPIMVRGDSYTNLFSKFDLQSRLQDTMKVLTEEDYLLYAEQQCRNWTPKEVAALKACFATIDSFIRKNNLRLELPVVRIIKSTCKEEYGAEGYTRGNNIMLNAGSDITTHIVAHELFHVYSRHNQVKRNTLYLGIGFKRCDHIDMKTAFNGRNVTNPDCPVISHYITVNNEDMVIALYSPRDYKGGNAFQEYMKIGLLVLEDKDKRKVPKMVNGEPVVKEFSEVPDIFRQIGSNTGYALHPEEIMAETFAALIMQKNVKEPAYLSKMKIVLEE
jgi:hypothetical protein